MKKILYSHPNITIGALALIFLAVLVAFYVRAIDGVVAPLHAALMAPPSESKSGFDLQGAAKLDLRGLVKPSSSTTTAQ